MNYSLFSFLVLVFSVFFALAGCSGDAPPIGKKPADVSGVANIRNIASPVTVVFDYEPVQFRAKIENVHKRTYAGRGEFRIIDIIDITAPDKVLVPRGQIHICVKDCGSDPIYPKVVVDDSQLKKGSRVLISAKYTELHTSPGKKIQKSSLITHVTSILAVDSQ